MDRDGQLQLDLTDVHGKYLGERVDIMLRHMVLSHNPVVSVKATKQILIKNLYGAPQGLYRVEIDPPSYLPVSRFVHLRADGPTPLQIPFPVDPKKVKKVGFPLFEALGEDFRQLLDRSDDVLGFPGISGKKLYRALDDIRRAGLLNIAAKTRSTPLTNGKTVFPYILTISELRGDRFFAFVQRELREETKNSVAEGLFRPVSASLHHLPDRFAGFSEAGSFKTEDAYGNLQLTFFMSADQCVADIDIDDASGLEHVFQVVRNALPDRATHPYDIRDILILHQKLDPGYALYV